MQVETRVPETFLLPPAPGMGCPLGKSGRPICSCPLVGGGFRTSSGPDICQLQQDPGALRAAHEAGECGCLSAPAQLCPQLTLCHLEAQMLLK